jgi:hypothetical protein
MEAACSDKNLVLVRNRISAVQARRYTDWANQNFTCIRYKANGVGRAVAQAVSRWLPTAAVWVRARAACGICGGQSGTGAGLLRVLLFPLPIIPPSYPSS